MGVSLPDVILYHTTAFGTTEHWRGTRRPGGRVRPHGPSQARLRPAGERLEPGWRRATRPGRAGADRAGRGGLGHRRRGAAGGPDRRRGPGLGGASRRAGASLITTEVEADRVRAEYGPAAHGFAELVEVPWHEPGRVRGRRRRSWRARRAGRWPPTATRPSAPTRRTT